MARTKQVAGKAPKKTTSGKTPTQNKRKSHSENTSRSMSSKKKKNKKNSQKGSKKGSQKKGKRNEKKEKVVAKEKKREQEGEDQEENKNEDEKEEVKEEVKVEEEEGEKKKEKKGKRKFSADYNRRRRLEIAAKNAGKIHFPKASIRKFAMNVINADNTKTINCHSISKDAVLALRDIVEGVVFRDHLLPCAKNIRFRGRTTFDPATEMICREEMSSRHPELNIQWDVTEFGELRDKRRRGFTLPLSEEQKKKNARVRAYKRAKERAQDGGEERDRSKGRRSRSRGGGKKKSQKTK